MSGRRITRECVIPAVSVSQLVYSPREQAQTLTNDERPHGAVIEKAATARCELLYGLLSPRTHVFKTPSR